MTTAELAFACIGGVGLALLLVSLIADHDFGHGGGAELHGGDATVDDGAPSVLNLSVISAGLVGVGAGGLVTLLLGGLLMIALGSAVVGGALFGAFVLFGVLRPLARQQSSVNVSRQSYQGLVGTLRLAIPGTGECGEFVFVDSAREPATQMAWSHLGQPIPAGIQVVVVEVTDRGVLVAPLDQPPLEGSK
jgi:hypothetical protein